MSVRVNESERVHTKSFIAVFIAVFSCLFLSGVLTSNASYKAGYAPVAQLGGASGYGPRGHFGNFWELTTYAPIAQLDRASGYGPEGRFGNFWELITYAPIAQLDRASGYGPEGRGFKSSSACHGEPLRNLDFTRFRRGFGV